MTDHATKHVKQRRNLLPDKRRKYRLILLALVLFLGSWAFLFHREKLHVVSEVLTWLKQNNPGEVLASTPPSSARGDIYDRNFRPLAVTYNTYAIYVRPLEMADPERSAGLLAEILGSEKSKMLTALKSERGFVWIAEGIDQKLADAIKKHNIRGVYQVVETKRFYPNNESAAHVVGFVENDQGLDGIEFQYNTLLRGDEVNRAELEALRFSPDTNFGKSGSHLVLNLDLMIQSKIEQFLGKRIRSTGAANGTVIVMDANTGAVLSMASYPLFNPNRYWEFPSTALNNQALARPVYSGELSLIFRQAAAINAGIDQQSVASQASEASGSIVVIAPEKMKKKRLSVGMQVDPVEPEYLARFAQALGFDQKPTTDIPLKDEAPASENLLLSDSDFHASALRFLTAFTALVNGGRLITPHLLQSVYTDGNTTPLEPLVVQSEPPVVLHPETSKKLAAYLAANWLKTGRRSRGESTPMFFEAHRFSTPGKNLQSQEQHKDGNNIETENTFHITQSVMLGAIPGKNTLLTMIAVLSYPDSTDAVYPETLHKFGDKLSILAPDGDMIQKMLHVAAMTPPQPSADFWRAGGTFLSGNLDPLAGENMETGATAAGGSKSMPDVTGKSLRAGLQALQHYDLEIKLVGTGRILTQKPPAGTDLKNIRECTLEMQQDI